MNEIKIGQFIRKLRTEKGMTQQQLADSLHVSVPAVSKWENGKGLPDVSLFEPLSEVLGVSISDLFVGELAAESNDEPVKEAINLSQRQSRRRFRMIQIVAAILAAALLIAGLLLYESFMREDRTHFGQIINLHIKKAEIAVEVSCEGYSASMKKVSLRQEGSTILISTSMLYNSLVNSSQKADASISPKGEYDTIALEDGTVIWKNGTVIEAQARVIKHYLNKEKYLQDSSELTGLLSSLRSDEMIPENERSKILIDSSRPIWKNGNSEIEEEMYFTLDEGNEDQLKQYCTAVFAIISPLEKMKVRSGDYIFTFTRQQAEKYLNESLSSFKADELSIQKLIERLSLYNSIETYPIVHVDAYK